MNLVLTRGREGVQNTKNLADVICACPLRMFHTLWTEIDLEMAAPHDTNMSHEIHITGERATAPLLHSQVHSLACP